ncbi:MAG: ABC transporter permease [Bacteroidota bacterium]
MLKNYLKIALRSFVNNKAYSAINVIGLAVGIASCLLIGLYVHHELAYDTFHEQYDELYRVVETSASDGRAEVYASTFSALAPAVKAEYPSIEQITRVFPSSGLFIGPDHTKHQEDNIIFADSSFFTMFSFTFVEGEPTRALQKPMSIVITEEAAVKFFGKENPIGKTLSLKDMRTTGDFEVTAVVKHPPTNSHIQFDYVLSYESLKTIRPWEYNVQYYPPVYTYVQLASKKDAADIERLFPTFVQKYYAGYNIEERKSAFGLQPVSEIRLHSKLQNEMSPNFDIKYIYLFAAIAIFILFLACINFMNLATARSLKRAKEVGMRKTMGAYRTQVIGQFLGEAFVMTALGFLLGILMVELFLPFFNEMTGKDLSTWILLDYRAILSSIALLFLVGSVAGGYPAFYLSSFRPLRTLKGSMSAAGSSTAFLRRGLVVFQFLISSALIFATGVITLQLDFVKNDRLGFNKDQVLIIPVRETDNQFNVQTLKQEMLRIPGVESASAVSGLPGIQTGIHNFWVIPEINKGDSAMVKTLTVDHDYGKTLELEFLEGRDFSFDLTTDETEAFVINETAAKRFGWTDSPVGKEVTLVYYLSGRVRKKGKIVGMVKDFQYHSLHSSYDPIIIHVDKKTYYHDYLSVRLSSDNVSGIIPAIEDNWASFSPERPFEFFFLDETFDVMYESETRLSSIFRAFSLVAIFIACLGLFGLASYNIEQRMKEIGIRKVLGAKIYDIVSLLSREITTLILISQVIALPMAYLFMKEWLNNYEDRISISIWLFVFSSVTILFIAWCTVSYQSVKASLSNPVQSLKTD